MNAASLDPRELRAYVGDDAFCEVEPATIAFVDLETTGLSKACYPFCVGIGLWRDDSFAVYHYFMTSADDEPAMLAATAEVLAEAQAVCTFNGASFDLPMLRRRFQHHGLDHPIDELAQIDLLRVSRRLLSHRDSHKLSRLEEDVLGFERHDDVAGAKIPPRWRRYLRSGDTELLVDIFEHNRLDIISMVVLMRYFAEYDPEREHDSRGSKHRGGLSPQAPPDRPRGKLASRLARSYALRDKASRRKSADDPVPPDDSAKSERDSVKLAGSFSRSDLRQKMPVGTRLRELRRGVDRCLDQGQPHEALAMLHEMVALSPRHPFALEKLVEHYRQSGDKKLADHFAARLEESSPF